MLARDLPSPEKRRIVAIVTAEITKDSIHKNGLYQNIFFLYLLFEAMGAIPVFLVNEKVAFFLPSRCYTFTEFIEKPFPLAAFIEVGLNTQPHIRRFMRQCGAKIHRLYLGNVFNIDVETPIYYSPLNFTHHSTGETDHILVSPHYAHYSEFLVAIDKAPCTVAPYIWDPYFIQRCTPWKHGSRQFIIMEPNISFQKNAVLPLLALESAASSAAEIIVVNGDRLMASPYCKALIESLNISVTMRPRMTLEEVTREWPSATIVAYHKDNELNYLTLEFLHLGYPVIHNAKTWSKVGYYYEGDSIEQCAHYIRATEKHADCLSTYRSQVQALIWEHSIHNPIVQKKWGAIISI